MSISGNDRTCLVHFCQCQRSEESFSLDRSWLPRKERRLGVGRQSSLRNESDCKTGSYPKGPLSILFSRAVRRSLKYGERFLCVGSPTTGLWSQGFGTLGITFLFSCTESLSGKDFCLSSVYCRSFKKVTNRLAVGPRRTLGLIYLGNAGGLAPFPESTAAAEAWVLSAARPWMSFRMATARRR